MQKSCKRCTWLTWLMTCTKLEAFRKPRKNGLETCERAESVRKFGRVKVRSWAMLFRIWNVWSDASWTPGTCSRRIDTWCRSARASQVHRMWTWELHEKHEHGNMIWTCNIEHKRCFQSADMWSEESALNMKLWCVEHVDKDGQHTCHASGGSVFSGFHSLGAIAECCLVPWVIGCHSWVPCSVLLPAAMGCHVQNLWRSLLSTLIWSPRICSPLLDTGSYVAITLKAQKLVYAGLYAGMIFFDMFHTE